jgi:CHASE3 domain sensor protein
MMWAHKTKRVLFWTGLSLPVVALAGMMWLVYQSGGQSDKSFKWIMRAYKVQDTFERAQAHIVDAEANQRCFLLTGRKEFIEPYERAMQLVRNDLADLKLLTADQPEQRANRLKLEQLVDGELTFDPEHAFKPGQSPADASVVAVTEQGKQKLERIRSLVFQAHQEGQEALSRHEQERASNEQTNQIMSLVLIIGVALALAMVVIILIRLEKLQEFVTVCSWTGQVNFQGKWLRLDEYLKTRFGIAVSHSLSREAADRMLREIEKMNPHDETSPKP